MTYPLRAPAHRVLVGEASRRSGLTTRAIRFYEEQGLIRSERGQTGERLYDAGMLERLEFIALGRRVGLSIEEVGRLLQTGDRLDRRTRDEDFARACVRRLGELEAQREVVEAALAMASLDIGGRRGLETPKDRPVARTAPRSSSLASA